MEQIYRVTTSAHRNKGDIRYGTGFRARRIWLANQGDPDNKVTVEVMNGVFLDVTEDWEAGNFEAGKTIDAPAGNSAVAAYEHNRTGTGWPESRSGDSGSSGNVEHFTPNR